jgi:hypothetical protein
MGGRMSLRVEPQDHLGHESWELTARGEAEVYSGEVSHHSPPPPYL